MPDWRPGSAVRGPSSKRPHPANARTTARKTAAMPLDPRISRLLPSPAVHSGPPPMPQEPPAVKPTLTPSIIRTGGPCVVGTVDWVDPAQANRKRQRAEARAPRTKAHEGGRAVLDDLYRMKDSLQGRGFGLRVPVRLAQANHSLERLATRSGCLAARSFISIGSALMS